MRDVFTERHPRSCKEQQLQQEQHQKAPPQGESARWKSHPQMQAHSKQKIQSAAETTSFPT